MQHAAVAPQLPAQPLQGLQLRSFAERVCGKTHYLVERHTRLWKDTRLFPL